MPTHRINPRIPRYGIVDFLALLSIATAAFTAGIKTKDIKYTAEELRAKILGIHKPVTAAHQAPAPAAKP